MNKGTLIGIGAVIVVILGLSWLGNRDAEKQTDLRAAAAAANDARRQLAEETTSAAQQALIINPQDTTEYSLNSPAVFVEEEYCKLENDKMVVTISRKGGAVRAVQLKEYKRYGGDSLMLFNADRSGFDLNFFNAHGRDTHTSQHVFKVVQSDDNNLIMRLYADSTSWMEFRYTLIDGDYMLGFDIGFNNKDRIIDNRASNIGVSWLAVGPQQEKGHKYENQYTYMAYKGPGSKDVEEFKGGRKNEDDRDKKAAAKRKDIPTKIEWVAFKEQFFSAILISDFEPFSNGKIGFRNNPETSGYTKSFDARLELPYKQDTEGYNLKFYFGPNDYKLMKSYGLELQKLIPMGWSLMRWITVGIIIPTFDFFGRYIVNYGIIILFLTLFIKFLIAPITTPTYTASAKRRLLKKDVAAINARYAKDSEAMKRQQATQELHKSAGISMLAGCLPALLQFPILIAMFRFFPASIELRQKSFLWADDLSAYDDLIKLPFNFPGLGTHLSLFAILMAVVMAFSTIINMQGNDQMGAQGKSMKIMMYFMPVMMLFFFNSSASALSYYFLLSNLITIGQIYLGRALVNENKMRAQMKEYNKKPKKKSNWQKMMENAARQQQQAAKKK